MHTLSNLRGLYKAMKTADITRYKWRFTRGPATFEAIFIIVEDPPPFELLLGAIGTRFGTTLRVYPGSHADPQLPTEDSFALRDALHLPPDRPRPFRPVDFFADLDAKIPQAVNLTPGRVQPHDVLAYRRHVDEAEKIYFCGWLDNTLAGGHVTPGNLEKTFKAFGQRVYEFCRKHNVSSKWTADRRLAQDYREPPPPSA